MALPDYQTLMLPVLRLASSEETTVPALLDTIADAFELTEEREERYSATICLSATRTTARRSSRP